MKNLEEMTWGLVSLNKTFSNHHGKRLTIDNRKVGDTPLLTAGENNNGVSDFISNSNMPRYSHFISVDMFGNVFFHPYCATGDDNIYFFENDNLDDLAKEFICISIYKQTRKFSFGKQFRQSNADSLKILLPITDSGEPDYEYMDEYISQKRKALLSKCVTYIKERLEELGESVEILMLNEKEWLDFRIGDLFEVSRPSPRVKDDYKLGNIPFVASGGMDNGVMMFCEPLGDEVLDKKYCITVSPVDGTSFFQPMNFLGRGGAGSSILILRCKGLNLYRGQFMAISIQKTCSKYLYGHMGNKNTIKHERIMLPITNSGEPDYEYMEQYTKNMMISKYQQYLTFLQKHSNTSGHR